MSRPYFRAANLILRVKEKKEKCVLAKRIPKEACVSHAVQIHDRVQEKTYFAKLKSHGETERNSKSVNRITKAFKKKPETKNFISKLRAFERKDAS